MDEDELERLREERKEQLQDESSDAAENQIEQRRKQIRQQAAQYLTKDAKSRLGNIRAAQPELASIIEMHIVRLGETQQLDKVTDDQLKQILRSIQQEKSQNQTDIKFRR